MKGTGHISQPQKVSFYGSPPAPVKMCIFDPANHLLLSMSQVYLSIEVMQRHGKSAIDSFTVDMSSWQHTRGSSADEKMLSISGLDCFNKYSHVLRPPPPHHLSNPLLIHCQYVFRSARDGMQNVNGICKFWVQLIFY